jgi:RNA polymerase sigma factor (sigma-70 family)
MHDALKHLRTLYRYGVTGHLTDEQLLDRFVARRDESGEEAFAELVERHGTMVLGVCRRVLGDAHDAEDAFQATFLVLARKATTILRREHVVSWLYGVAFRTALQARARSARRRKREERVSRSARVDPPNFEFTEELRAILDEEIARLPARYQGALVLCELEGVSRPEAARRLGVPEGTLSSRLARAKGQLRDRLVQRGVGVTAGALSAALVREVHACKLPLSLSESTVGAATSVAAGSATAAAVSASVASLTEGVLKAMLFAKLKGTVLGIGTFAALLSSAVVVAQGPVGGGGNGKPGSADADRTAAVEKKLDRILSALERLSRLEARDAPQQPADEGSELKGPNKFSRSNEPRSQDAPDAPNEAARGPRGDRSARHPQNEAPNSGKQGGDKNSNNRPWLQSQDADKLPPLGLPPQADQPEEQKQSPRASDRNDDAALELAQSGQSSSKAQEQPGGQSGSRRSNSDASQQIGGRQNVLSADLEIRSMSLSDRLTAVEQQVQHAGDALRRLEERLNALERLVGKSDQLRFEEVVPHGRGSKAGGMGFGGSTAGGMFFGGGTAGGVGGTGGGTVGGMGGGVR